MQFNHDVNNQAHGVVFPRKLDKKVQPQIAFNNSLLFRSNFQKYLGVYFNFQSPIWQPAIAKAFFNEKCV